MEPVSRRHFCSLLCGCVAVASIEPASARQLKLATRGCTVLDEAAMVASRDIALGRNITDLTLGSITRTTRNPDLDRALDRALQRLSQTFGVRPGFGFYDDYDGENAVALSKTMLPDTTGTVLFGNRLFATLMRFDAAGGAVMWTAAHEFAHVWLYQTDHRPKLMQGQNNVKRVELHADYLAGFYLGDRKRSEPNISLMNAGKDIWNSGDTEYNSPAHHGTPAQRLAAAEAGFKLAFIDKHDAAYAFEAGLDYVMKL